MKNLYLLFAFVLLTLFSCKNECQDLLDQIHEAKSTYESAPTQANCIAYQNLLQSYINGSCESNSQGVNYDVLFQDYLNDLDCGSLPSTTCGNGVQDGDETGVDCGGSCTPCGTTVPTCTDGIMNGDETGVDCGGTSCPPCSSNNYYMRCEIDGTPWDAYMLGFMAASIDFSGYLNGFISYTNEGQIRIGNLDDFLQTGSYVFTNGAMSSGLASFSYVPEVLGTSPNHFYEPVGNNGSLVITAVNITDSTVTGTFSVDVYDDNFTPFDTISITNGEFYVPFTN